MDFSGVFLALLVKYHVGAIQPEIHEWVYKTVPNCVAVMADPKVVVADVIQGGRSVSLGLGPDLDPKPFCKSAWGNNDGGSSEY